jgi:cobyrinic acid a,c-diamide synthase
MLPTDLPRILIAALRGGSGKTVLSVGIIAALAKQEKNNFAF